MVSYKLAEANIHKAIASGLEVFEQGKTFITVKLYIFPSDFAYFWNFVCMCWLAFFLNKTGNNYYKIWPEQRLCSETHM